MTQASNYTTKFLVIRLSSMGDIVLTTPMLRALKTQLEGDVEVHFLCKKSFMGLVESNPRIDQVHTFEKTIQEVLPTLEQIGFDYIIDLHRNVRSAIVKRRLGVLAFAFDKLNFKKWLLVNTGWNTLPALHIVDRYRETLKGFGVQDDGLGLEYYIPSQQGLNASQLGLLHQSPFIAVVLGGAHDGKKPSTQKWLEWLSGIQHPMVLIGGPEDTGVAEAIAAQVPCLQWAGQLSVHQSADVIRNAELVLTGDTGMMHIASAFGRKIVSLWGCTTPGLGMSPYRAHAASEIIEPQGRERRPCSKLGNRCKYGMAKKCIDQITTAQVLSAIERSWVQ